MSNIQSDLCQQRSSYASTVVAGPGTCANESVNHGSPGTGESGHSQLAAAQLTSGKKTPFKGSPRPDMDLFLDALTPRDHSQELVQLQLTHLELESQDKQNRSPSNVLYHLLMRDKDVFPYASHNQCPGIAHSSEARGGRSIISASSSVSSIEAGPSGELSDSRLERPGNNVGPVKRASKSPSKSRNIIYPRRKGGQDSRKTSQVVVTAEVLEKHFHLPLHDAATKLGLCATAIKKVCRRFGILRWPFRDHHRLNMNTRHQCSGAQSEDSAAAAPDASARDWSPICTSTATPRICLQQRPRGRAQAKRRSLLQPCHQKHQAHQARMHAAWSNPSKTPGVRAARAPRAALKASHQLRCKKCEGARDEGVATSRDRACA